MRLPDQLFVGVEATLDDDAPDAPHVEIGGFAELPTPKQIDSFAGKRSRTIIGWHVLTHRRTDPRYKQMADPPPEHAAVGHFERSRWTDEAWEAIDRLARATDTMAAVFRTPATFKANEEHATRLENFVAHGVRPGLSIAWEPAGRSWPAKKMLALCDRIGAIPVVDPTESDIPEGELIYLRFRGGANGKKQLRDDDLKKVALEARDRIGWVIFSRSSSRRGTGSAGSSSRTRTRSRTRTASCR